MLKASCRSILRTESRPMLKAGCRSILRTGSRPVHIRLFGVDRYLIADLSSILSSSKLMSKMDFEFPSSCVHQDLVNVLGMALVVVDRCSSVVRRSLVVVDRFSLVVADQRHLI
ncbi:hypothetical protein DY000_02052918 [Brassica cretica]|uniref:Uncharacterized protein n=1 Tax=Brassica cretica TaxID=69181 RepID=A0ABQ7AID1_BRACR|nr:hypothetical protein DY000_02052918 [Brassica cretica]